MAKASPSKHRLRHDRNIIFIINLIGTHCHLRGGENGTKHNLTKCNRTQFPGRVHELRKMDKMTHFEIKIGLLRKAESGFGLLKKQTFEPKGGVLAAFGKFVNTP